MSPSCLSSSSGPSRASRRWRLLAEISRAVFVIVRRGRSARPAISQPSQIDSTAMTARAMPQSTSSWWSAAADCALAAATIVFGSGPNPKGLDFTAIPWTVPDTEITPAFPEETKKLPVY